MVWIVVFLVLSGFLFDVFPLICSKMDEMELFQRKIGNWDGTRSFFNIKIGEPFDIKCMVVNGYYGLWNV